MLDHGEDGGGGAGGEVRRLDAVLQGEAHGAEEAVVVAELADVVADDAGDEVVEVGADHAVEQVVGVGAIAVGGEERIAEVRVLADEGGAGFVEEGAAGDVP